MKAKTDGSAGVVKRSCFPRIKTQQQHVLFPLNDKIERPVPGMFLDGIKGLMLKRLNFILLLEIEVVVVEVVVEVLLEVVNVIVYLIIVVGIVIFTTQLFFFEIVVVEQKSILKPNITVLRVCSRSAWYVKLFFLFFLLGSLLKQLYLQKIKQTKP